MKEPKSLLNHAEFIVLGLIAEQSSHAYNINKRIEERGMRDWTNIGRSSIYRVIKNLEKRGLTDKWIEEIDNRTLNVYQITTNGSRILMEQVFNTLKYFIGKNDENFYVAFSMLPILTNEQLIEAFSYSIETIKNHIFELEKMLADNPNYPINVSGLFIHPIKILQTDIEFLETVLKEIKKGDGLNDSKVSSK